MRKKAFTLIELIVVIAILGILALIVVGAKGAVGTTLPEDATFAQSQEFDGCTFELYTSASTGQRYQKNLCNNEVSVVEDED